MIGELTGKGNKTIVLVDTDGTLNGQLVTRTGRYKPFMIGGGVILMLGIFLLCFIVPVLIMWGYAIINLFSRHDLDLGPRLLWLLVILVLPIIGSVAMRYQAVLRSLLSMARLNSARLVAGIARWRRPSSDRNDTGTRPKSSVVGPRPFDGSQPSITENTMISIRPTQNVGSEKPRIDPAMIIGTGMIRALWSVARPTVIVRTSGWLRNSSPMRRSPQIWMNWRTATVTTTASPALRKRMRNSRQLDA